jgi:N-acetylmuramoyl-L-alanine amidase
MTLDEFIAACTLYGECRGEPLVGQQAVAHVLVNRKASGKWGPSFQSVCQSHAQFSCWLQSDPNYPKMLSLSSDDPELKYLLAVLRSATPEVDFTNGAMFYYSPRVIAQPLWAKSMVLCGQFGNQIFLKEKQS